MGALKIGKNTVKAILLVVTVVMALALVASAWGGVVHPHDSRLLPLLTLGMPFFLKRELSHSRPCFLNQANSCPCFKLMNKIDSFLYTAFYILLT